MKTDTIFYRLFQSFPSIFFELINQPPETANTYEFSSVEVKQLAFRIDGVFLPKSNPLSPIYFVEVQFQPDKKFYSRLFSEIFLYLDQTQLTNNWRGVVVYPSRSIDVGATERYTELLTSGRVTRIYLDELDSTASQSIGIETVKLVVEPENSAVTKARELINLAKQQITSEISQQEFLKLIETIIIYKFPQKSREEIEQMFGFSELKQTKVYQEAKQEGKEEGKLEGRLQGKLEAIPFMLNLGATVEQIAEALSLDIELVRLVAAKANANQQANGESR
ncbi:Rpn family recombination-promoting nuclease/putative transposase [Calothrix sp. FACHB-1219]|uniref:Rpn family recombination-promoting nuclease/putative transposase n=1 Tax=unclassified Calothrix TaxID=2619626 RepID=UPI0016870869|nr:Rpn family recombination-promoting nuclease/putative transposase [Calothrix sp. FACHB-168]MBD2202518.1 Rpn family recombination-promoting nuclease/putative transposase [Calothrix sp. FACHB-168]MBD2217891.1 Rpn family recombination-promoting nuclease/putative transposase [Calothrix sp. FACHB-1219]